MVCFVLFCVFQIGRNIKGVSCSSGRGRQAILVLWARFCTAKHQNNLCGRTLQKVVADRVKAGMGLVVRGKGNFRSGHGKGHEALGL